MKWGLVVTALAFVACAVSSNSVATAQLAFEQPPINYSKTEASDPVAYLLNRVEQKRATLPSDAKTGYLVALLEQLQIPVSSQTLVFSKTSLQRHLISSKNPRAIYFNDDTYVGWVPEGELIEIASVDPNLGTIFYTIEQPSAKHPGNFSRRNDRCLFCHASTDTGRVPGLLMQSVYTNSNGDRTFPDNLAPTNSRGPLLGRWAGWFVTGNCGAQQHLGNLMLESNDAEPPRSIQSRENIDDLSRWFDVDNYLSPHSDLVALLVLQHQVSMHNLLTDANHRARRVIHEATSASSGNDEDQLRLSDEDLFRIDQIAERLVDGLLMVGQIRFSEPVSGSSRYASQFAARGPRDLKGRSLRDLDLQETVFRYPCSYVIYSESFDALPPPLLRAVKRRLIDVLSSKDNRAKYSTLTAASRSEIMQILRETKPSLLAR